MRTIDGDRSRESFVTELFGLISGRSLFDTIQFPLNPYDISARGDTLLATVTMIGKAKERWMELCEQAANEQDSQKLIELVTEINRLLVEKEKRLAIRSAEPTQE